MSTAENIALERRVETLERRLIAAEPVRIKTILRVCERGDEEPCRTVEDVYRLSKRPPVIRIVREIDDLDVLIEPATGCHLQRADAANFDELAEGVRVIEVVIDCHAIQLQQITSCKPVTDTVGGARAGKTRVLVWWLFRQWLLRGHGADEDYPKPALFWWIREDSEKLYEHAIQWLVALWPAELFVGRLPTKTTKHPVLTLIDNSTIAFRHANFSGSRAGSNLRSAEVDGAAIDEKSAIVNRENYSEILNRLGTVGGLVASAYTPFTGHWSEDDDHTGSACSFQRVTMWDNPWWTYAKIWLHFLRNKDLTDAQLADILVSDDPVKAATDAIQDPLARSKYFGESHARGLTLWREWDAVRFTVKGADRFTQTFKLGDRALPNITSHVFGDYFGNAARRITVAGGIDFNINPGVCVVFSVYGTHAAPLVVVWAEVATHGTTLKSAKHIGAQHPGLCAHGDPTGANEGRHASHGDRRITNIQEMRNEGLHVLPANGTRRGKAVQLGQLDSINPMHRAMSLGLLRVHDRCIGTLRALRTMQSNPDGTIKKVSGVNSISDQVSGYGDALRYGVYRVYLELITPGGAFH